jgi:hypothetical protein
MLNFAERGTTKDGVRCVVGCNWNISPRQDARTKRRREQRALNNYFRALQPPSWARHCLFMRCARLQQCAVQFSTCCRLVCKSINISERGRRWRAPTAAGHSQPPRLLSIFALAKLWSGSGITHADSLDSAFGKLPRPSCDIEMQAENHTWNFGDKHILKKLVCYFFSVYNLFQSHISW